MTEENGYDAVAAERKRKTEIRGGRATFLPLTTIRGGMLRENLSDIDGFVAIACDLVGFDERYRNVMGYG